MSLEQGLVSLIQSGTDELAPGGFMGTIPEAYAVTASNPKVWVFHMILNTPTVVLEGADALCEAEVQIDCHGYTSDDAVALAAAIKSALLGVGNPVTLSDPDHTVVQGVFRRSPHIDGYSDANHTYVRTLEYLVTYYDQQ
jgi:hypothetical protein